MRRAERVVDVTVREPLQSPGEIGIVVLFSRMEAQVFEQEQLATLQLCRLLLRLASEAVVRPLHIGSDELLLFSTDYPHWQFDGMAALPEGLSPDLVRRILVQNPRETYTRLTEMVT